MPIQKILLVDDSKTELHALSEMLTKRGYQVRTAENGEDAWRRLQEEKPDLILMDVVMPHMTGVEACRAIRSAEATRHIPIILVTTKGDGDSVETGFASGCTDYVTKPINGPELLSKLRDQIGE